MTDRELLQMALDALNNFDKGNHGMRWQVPIIKALRAALAQPEPEPVAWDDAPTKIYLQICDDVDCDLSFEAHDDVSWCQDKVNDCDIAYIRADTAPPQRDWQGLTDEEIKYIAAYGHQVTANVWVENFARAIEAKLKEKNT